MSFSLVILKHYKTLRHLSSPLIFVSQSPRTNSTAIVTLLHRYCPESMWIVVGRPSEGALVAAVVLSSDEPDTPTASCEAMSRSNAHVRNVQRVLLHSCTQTYLIPDYVYRVSTRMSEELYLLGCDAV
jgi:hypothetical protein